ncbi:MAG: hypothetical protein ABI806_05900 [Candidatus Solibacter sp.]
MKLRLRIAALSLDGLDLGSHQEPQLRAALEAELTACFSRCEIFGSSQTVRLAVQMPELTAEADRLGAQIARAIHGSVPRHVE